ncbi:hypothetical protein HK102_003389 [Quaeritorhiza haematococci]|nr:hypothetical protein HK102_003389 [Quaeritorhiza haematococci]
MVFVVFVMVRSGVSVGGPAGLAGVEREREEGVHLGRVHREALTEMVEVDVDFGGEKGVQNEEADAVEDGKESESEEEAEILVVEEEETYEECYEKALEKVKGDLKRERERVRYFDSDYFESMVEPLERCTHLQQQNSTHNNEHDRLTSPSLPVPGSKYLNLPTWSETYCPQLSDKVVFLVMGSSVNMRKIQWQYRSWMKRVPRENMFIFADDYEPGLERVVTLPEIYKKPTKEDAQLRQLHGMRWLYRHRPDVIARADWFVFADDDSYIDIPALARQLEQFPYPDLFFVMGHVWDNGDGWGSDGWLFSGGAGIVLTKTAFTSLAQTILHPTKCPFKEANDVTLSDCIRVLEGDFVHVSGFNPSIDGFGRDQTNFYTAVENLEWDALEKDVKRRADRRGMGLREGKEELVEKEEREEERSGYEQSISERAEMYSNLLSFHYVNEWKSHVALERWTDLVWGTDCGASFGSLDWEE